MDLFAGPGPPEDDASAGRVRLRDRVYKAPSAIHGAGVFARVSFAPGDHIGTYKGSPAKRDGTYVLWLYEEGKAPVGRSGRNILRYLNHAQPGNAEFRGFDLYALRPIAPGEEITFDYSGQHYANDNAREPGSAAPDLAVA